MSQHDGGVVEHHVAQIQIEACKAESGAIVKERLREKVRGAVDHFALWRGGGTPLENMNAFRGRLLGLIDLMQGHSAYQEALRTAAEMTKNEIDRFEPLPLDRQPAEEAIDEERTSGKLLRLSTGRAWIR